MWESEGWRERKREGRVGGRSSRSGGNENFLWAAPSLRPLSGPAFGDGGVVGGGGKGPPETVESAHASGGKQKSIVPGVTASQGRIRLS